MQIFLLQKKPGCNLVIHCVHHSFNFFQDMPQYVTFQIQQSLHHRNFFSFFNFIDYGHWSTRMVSVSYPTLLHFHVVHLTISLSSSPPPFISVTPILLSYMSIQCACVAYQSECKGLHPLWRVALAHPVKVNICWPYEPAVPFVDVYPGERKSYAHTKTWTPDSQHSEASVYARTW